MRHGFASGQCTGIISFQQQPVLASKSFLQQSFSSLLWAHLVKIKVVCLSGFVWNTANLSMDFTLLPANEVNRIPIPLLRGKLCSALLHSQRVGDISSGDFSSGVRSKLHILPLKWSTDGHLQVEALPAHIQWAQPTPPAPLPTQTQAQPQLLPAEHCQGSHTTSPSTTDTGTQPYPNAFARFISVA